MQNIFQKAWGDSLGVMDYGYQNDIYNPSKIAIFLSANYTNYQRLLALESFSNLLESTNLPKDIYGIKLSQIASLNSILKNLVSKEDVLYHLNELKIIDSEMIFYDFVKNCEQKAIKTDTQELLNESKNAILEQLKDLKELVDDKKSVEELEQKFKSSEFRVLVSGVLNSGKSSFINTLLKKDLLGVSNVPKTANMTLLKYSKTPPKEALVEYFDKDEWESIKAASKDSKEINEILQKANQSLIKSDKNTAYISTDELKTQSGADFDDAVLIKKITLYDDSEFLFGGISLCDTPGLDDVIATREMLSIKEAKKADVILHLTNCTQSLASKDIEFLNECVKDNTKLVIVLTKADLINEDELSSVKSYALDKIKKSLNKNDDFLDEINIFAISSHSGFGMDSLCGFLINDLFKKQSNSLISSTKAKIKSYAKDQIDVLNQKNTKLNLNKQEKDNDISSKQTKLDGSLKELSNLVSKADNANFTCDISLKNPFAMLSKSLSIKIVDNIAYNKSKISSTSFIKTALEDALSDIARDIYTKNINFLNAIYDEVGVLSKPEIDVKSSVLEFKDKFFMMIFPSVLNVINADYDPKDIQKTQLFISSKLSEVFNSFDKYDDFDISGIYKTKLYEYFDNLKQKINEEKSLISLNDTDEILRVYQKNTLDIQKLENIIKWCENDS